MLSCWRGSLSRGSLGQGSHDDDPWALPSRIRRWCGNVYYSTVRRARCCAVHHAAVKAVGSASRATGLNTANKGRHAAQGLVRKRLGSVAQALCRPFGVPEESPEYPRSLADGQHPTGPGVPRRTRATVSNDTPRADAAPAACKRRERAGAARSGHVHAPGAGERAGVAGPARWAQGSGRRAAPRGGKQPDSERGYDRGARAR